MLPDQFFYWLQGYFELSPDTDAALTDAQGECIGRHIDLVCETVKASSKFPTQIPERISEIRALLSVLHSDPDLITKRIRDTVNEQFQHVIDPKAGDADTQETLNTIHGGHAYDKPIYRC